MYLKHTLPARGQGRGATLQQYNALLLAAFDRAEFGRLYHRLFDRDIGEDIKGER